MKEQEPRTMIPSSDLVFWVSVQFAGLLISLGAVTSCAIPKGSKDSNNRALGGPKYYHANGILALNPIIWVPGPLGIVSCGLVSCKGFMIAT